ncbi:MAG TPA: phage baseplate assembly protein V [Allosphingosinicella sp.]|nr:phage baseplate assembly protein V [Allosphingosinicella sp.]
MYDRDLEHLYGLLGSRLFGKYRGLVKDNDDPLGCGRLEVTVPKVFGAQTIWAMPCVPVAGPKGAGLFAMPELGTNVWIEFEAGERDYPIWTGCFWPEGAIDAADARPTVKFWRTDSFIIRIDDEAGELTIEKTDGGKLTISATEVTAEANSVVQNAGGKKTTLSASGLDVLDGALTVV